MKKALKLILPILGFVLLIAGAYVLYNHLSSENSADRVIIRKESEKEKESSEGEKTAAPDFTVYDDDGKAYKLSDFIGKPTIVNFWASWCGPCKMEMPDFEEKYLELGSELNFLMVNMTDGSRETVSIASNFIDEQGYTFPVYYDTQSSAAITYSVYSLPTTYFIDADGYIIAQASGAIDAETLQKGIDMIKED
ncbi:MAG: TlpA family protein disulfide reductase [Ruminococcus sp.]|nr:TlpA family protein disulfide reductase [Ruminococcus sp.]